MPCASTSKPQTSFGFTSRVLRKSAIFYVMFVPLCALPITHAAPAAIGKGGSVDWPVYNGNLAGDHYSALSRINRSNVNQLKITWRFDAGKGLLETNPLIIGKTLYAYTPKQNVIALDAETGRLKWKFDPGSVNQRLAASFSYWGNVSEQPTRGLSYWTDGKEPRLFTSGGTYLYALDPSTGGIIDSFGEGGRLDLRKDLDRDYTTIPVFLTTPGIVYKDLIIVGFRTAEAKPAAPGAVRAYDTRSGKLRWIFHLIPRPGEAGYETWPKEAWRTAGGANVWAGIALDEKRGIVYVPTGSAVDDFYGADRLGDDLYANSLVALNAATGTYRWHFQVVHHDLWDRDLPSPPVLLTVQRGGRDVDAVAQISKHGFVFVFDRVSGAPLFPIEERSVPRSDVRGELASSFQPFPVMPAPFARQRITADLVTTRTIEARTLALTDLGTFRNEGQFTPLGVDRQTIVFPGFDGGAEWGGPAVDPGSSVIYVNSADTPSLGGLAVSTVAGTHSHGREVYERQCAGCHGMNREGAPQQFPRLVDISSRLRPSQITGIVLAGRGRMPGFQHLKTADIDSLVGYLSSGNDEPSPSCGDSADPCKAQGTGGEAGYVFTGYKKWLDVDGYPAVKPPWGTLSAIDLNTGQYLWRVPLGEYPELAAKGMHNTGTENYGGPLVTAGGLVFIGATVYDRKIRAFNSRTGQKLWEYELPFAGVATPATYMNNGRQYLVIACSGGRDPKGPQGSAYVTFALPREGNLGRQ
jgi:quinoprotein glucose dehydrogenase